MNQRKIGEFIASLRKEKGMTQKQLAEMIGVSDKTVSKWECGNGMPEMSIIMPLCQVLEISVNEFMSGQHLSEENYTEKAEENMKSLIEKSVNSEKKNRWSKISITTGLAAVLLAVAFTIKTSFGAWSAFIDAVTFIIILFTTVLMVWATGLGKPFFGAFRIILGKEQQTSKNEVIKSQIAVNLVSKTVLTVGVLVTVVTLAALGAIWRNANMSINTIGPNISVALLGSVYGIIGYALFIPIKYKLKIIELIGK